MKVSENFVMREIAGEIVVIPTGTVAQRFNGLISMNEVSAFIWEHLEACQTPEDMLALVLNEYDVSEDVARKDVFQFLADLKKAGMIED